MKTSKRIMILAFLLPVFMTALAAASGHTASAASGKMTVTAIDLRGGNSGEATMISAEDGTPLLVDSGDNCNRAVFDWLSDNGYGSRRFNTLVTHWHDDHAGNTAEIIRKYNVGTVYIPSTDYLDIRKTDYYRYEKTYATDILNAARARGTRVVYLKKGAVIKVGTGVSGEVLYINGSPITESGEGIEHINNQSAVIMFTGGGSRFLTAGDLSYQGEQRVLKSGEDLKADIMKINHHGYDTSSSWGFINAVKPTYAWYTSNSVSTEKFTSSMTRAASNRVSAIANTFSTRYNGTIRFVCSNGEIRVSAERNTVQMYEKLISKKTGSAKYVTYTFNNACEVHMSQKIVNTDLYHNKQLRAAKSGELFTGSWKDQDGNKYLVKGNIKALHTFAEKSGKIYYFDWHGRRRTGFVNAYGGRYFFSPSMATGWKVTDGRRYYFMDSKYSNYSKAKEGQMLTGFKKISGKDYYFMNAQCGSYKAAARGKLMTGFFKVSGKMYYGEDSKMKGDQAANLGVLQKGWVTISSKRYYFGADHVMRTGWLKLSGKIYYLFPGGSAAVNRFVTISGRKYYFDGNGVLQTGWKTIGGKKYYMFAGGTVAVNRFVTLNGKTYHFDGEGAMQTGWQTIDGKKYYFDKNGVMQTGEVVIGDKVYLFGEDGVFIEERDRKEASPAGSTAMTETAPETEPGTEGSEGIAEDPVPETASEGSTDGNGTAAEEEPQAGSTEDSGTGSSEEPWSEEADPQTGETDAQEEVTEPEDSPAGAEQPADPGDDPEVFGADESMIEESSGSGDLQGEEAEQTAAP